MPVLKSSPTRRGTAMNELQYLIRRVEEHMESVTADEIGVLAGKRVSETDCPTALKGRVSSSLLSKSAGTSCLCWTTTIFFHIWEKGD